MTVVSSEPTESAAQRHDAVTIVMHWLTALLVLVLFGTAHLWDLAPRAAGLRRPLESLHISLGILLATVLVARLGWRFFAARRLPPTETGIRRMLSSVVHGLLYVLLAGQVGLGFTLRWFQGEPLSFFGLFSVPQWVAANRGLSHQVQNLHDLTAWAIIVLAGGHAVMALAHHYLLKDRVLARMVPRLG